MKKSASANTLQQTARDVLLREADALKRAAMRLDGSLVAAARLILRHSGKIVVSGMGKSGLVAQKIAATLSSTGTPAVYLHPAEALHGDLGIYQKGDPTLLLSKSGATPEILNLLPMLRQFKSPVIALVGKRDSALAERADIVLDGVVESEADPLALVPTSSTTLALAVGDALACVLMKARAFKPDDFAKFHPGGQLGRNLLLCAGDVMRKKDDIALVSKKTPLRDVVIAMTRHPHGAACVVAKERLVGIITDGDIRRALQSHDDIRGLCAENVMTPSPVRTVARTSLAEALRLMEGRSSQISVLPIVDNAGKVAGLLRLHDAYQSPQV